MDLKNTFAIAVAILLGTSALASAQTGEGPPPYIQPGGGYPFGYSYYDYGYAPGVRARARLLLWVRAQLVRLCPGLRCLDRRLVKRRGCGLDPSTRRRPIDANAPFRRLATRYRWETIRVWAFPFHPQLKAAARSGDLSPGYLLSSSGATQPLLKFNLRCEEHSQSQPFSRTGRRRQKEIRPCRLASPHPLSPMLW